MRRLVLHQVLPCPLSGLVRGPATPLRRPQGGCREGRAARLGLHAALRCLSVRSPPQYRTGPQGNGLRQSRPYRSGRRRAGPSSWGRSIPALRAKFRPLRAEEPGPGPWSGSRGADATRRIRFKADGAGKGRERMPQDATAKAGAARRGRGVLQAGAARRGGSETEPAGLKPRDWDCEPCPARQAEGRLFAHPSSLESTAVARSGGRRSAKRVQEGEGASAKCGAREGV